MHQEMHWSLTLRFFCMTWIWIMPKSLYLCDVMTLSYKRDYHFLDANVMWFQLEILNWAEKSLHTLPFHTKIKPTSLRVACVFSYRIGLRCDRGEADQVVIGRAHLLSHCQILRTELLARCNVIVIQIWKHKGIIPIVRINTPGSGIRSENIVFNSLYTLNMWHLLLMMMRFRHICTIMFPANHSHKEQSLI